MNNSMKITMNRSKQSLFIIVLFTIFLIIPAILFLHLIRNRNIDPPDPVKLENQLPALRKLNSGQNNSDPIIYPASGYISYAPVDNILGFPAGYFVRGTLTQDPYEKDGSLYVSVIFEPKGYPKLEAILDLGLKDENILVFETDTVEHRQLQKWVPTKIADLADKIYIKEPFQAKIIVDQDENIDKFAEHFKRDPIRIATLNSAKSLNQNNFFLIKALKEGTAFNEGTVIGPVCSFILTNNFADTK